METTAKITTTCQTITASTAAAATITPNNFLPTF